MSIENYERYEKPDLKFVSLRNNRVVAAGNCWSQEANTGGKTWYYDSKGKGYIEFTLDQSCSGNPESLTSYEAHNYESQEDANTAIAYLQGQLKDTIKQGLIGISNYLSCRRTV